MTTIFEGAQSRLTDIFNRIHVADDVRERLTYPKLALSVSIPVRMDDASLRVFKGYRVQFDDTRGPTFLISHKNPASDLVRISSTASSFAVVLGGIRTEASHAVSEDRACAN